MKWFLCVRLFEGELGDLDEILLALESVNESEIQDKQNFLEERRITTYVVLAKNFKSAQKKVRKYLENGGTRGFLEKKFIKPTRE